MGGHRGKGFFLFGPELEPSSRQPLLTAPEPLAVVTDYFERCGAPVTEDKKVSAHGVHHKTLYCPRKTVYPFSEVDRFHGEEYPHLGSNLYHLSQNSLASSTTLQFPLILILSPVGFSISMVHSILAATGSSMKVI